MQMSRIEQIQTDVVRIVTSAQGQSATMSPSPTVNGAAQSVSETRLPLSEFSQAQPSEKGRKALEEVVDEMNRHFQQRNIALNFSIDDDTDTLVVKVIDQSADKVIRQIPPDAILALKKNIQSMMGALFDGEA
jgi:flagellar protein FlaG